MLPQELAQRIKAAKAPIVLDVRSGHEFNSGHIPGAILAPAWKILLRLAKIPADKGSELVLTCEQGPRALAKGLLHFLGYINVVLLDGHMAKWPQAGLPLQK